MSQYKFDVIIIGAGPAGIAAAGSLGGTGISVAVIEAGVYAGAENWSGCVYFAENLSRDDCFGRVAVEKAPFERRVVRRGTLLHNGMDVVGVEYTNPDTFRDCYTVIRPIYDPYFALLAQEKGAVLITETTVTSLIRKNGAVIGVQTSRGPLYAGVVFIAEGDASHLVSSEGLERKKEPHFLQGVKAVMTISPDEIESRFNLKPGEGAAYEILIRNGSIAGRTARLNLAGFLYTNRDSLSLGYVAPLDNIRNHYRGGHDILFEWVKGLPYISELTSGARLMAYGAKIIRSGGWKEHPILTQNGLAVGGASAGLGVDIPYPNFTGPAAATGLYFGRAVKTLLKDGRPFDAKGLSEAYAEPLMHSVYGRNARHLADWPGYFGRSSVLFGRTADILCGGARFLSTGSTDQAARFFRSHILSLRGLKELLTDTIHAVSALRLWKPIIKTVLNPVTVWRWFVNIFKKPASPERFRMIMHLNGKDLDPVLLTKPLGPFLRRLMPGLASAAGGVYANDDQAIDKKLARAVKAVARSVGITDLVMIPVFGIRLFFAALGTAVLDAFRFYILKTPVQKFLEEPVMVYNEAQRKIRSLDAIRPGMSLEAKLATNTYRLDRSSHIKTLWPEAIERQPEMSQAGLWWVCPARVYEYDASLMGRGKVTVNFENCIKCESCWRAEPLRVLWGRHTGHKLVYRPHSQAASELIAALQKGAVRFPGRPETLQRPKPVVDAEITTLLNRALSASLAFRDAIQRLPISADLARRKWPKDIGRRLIERLTILESALRDRGLVEHASELRTEHHALENSIGEGRLFHSLYSCLRLEAMLRAFIPEASSIPLDTAHDKDLDASRVSYEEVIKVFPDRIVKEWEDNPIPHEWIGRIRSFILEHRNEGPHFIRALASASPGLALIATGHIEAIKALEAAGRDIEPSICAVHADVMEMRETMGVRIKASMSLVPIGAADAILLRSGTKGYILPLNTPGIEVTPSPAIGFRPSGLAHISLDSSVPTERILTGLEDSEPDHISYLSIALGAGDYLCRRAKEHAVARVQFPGQMLDTEGRDGIAKLGAVKAMIARTEAWRLLLETVYCICISSGVGQRKPEALQSRHMELQLLSSALASMAFGPEPGSMSWEAGQVFGGFAYSEDDLLSRFYRDSAMFRFLSPGLDAARRLNERIGAQDLEGVLVEWLGSLEGITSPPIDRLVLRWRGLKEKISCLPPRCDNRLMGEARALALGLRALINRIDAGIDSGLSMELEAAVAETLLGTLEEAIYRAEKSEASREDPSPAVFPVEPSLKRLDIGIDYESFCKASGRPYRSGTFLVSVFNRSDRFVPEIQLHDPNLRKRWHELSEWFKKNCRDRKWDGLPFERYVERLHRLPDEIVAAVKHNRWLATYIPESEDGLGWRKAEYYILNSAAGIFGDAGICLLIMASTSIGTTPILLGLEDELPQVKKELAPLVSDPEKLGEIGARLRRIIKSLDNPNPTWIRKEYEIVMRLIDTRIRHTRVVKYFAANFLKAFYTAGIAGRRGDFAEFISNLRRAGDLFEGLMPDIHAALDDLPRRERFHRLFLRYLGHGGVSAFALTEPTAGSDSGGVKTTARLMSKSLEPMPDGRYRFLLDENEATGARYLIDANRIVFTEHGPAYLTPDERPARIKYDRYDYEADRGVRYYEYQGRQCEFHDIAQVRRTRSSLVYEYYSLTGSKMWITNGSIATQFCLYAQTDEGVTGFLVDRHSEGLKVGADEKKTGQRGSPTNEISLDGVRVPREAVIGYEGHGQVNALETLNVGRCGLAVVSAALMRKLILEARENIPPSSERDRLLSEAASILFGSESLAFYLVGLFDRPHESVRMESAIAKFICSEDIHEVISLLERAYGPSGQTEKYLLEKARRDSRILTVYEGTNEVQRFLILKDLIAMAGDWPELPEDLSESYDDTRAITLSRWKNRLRLHVKEAAKRFGDTAWQDAMLQPALFPLAEMAGEILRLECIYYRMEWLERRRILLDTETLDAAGPYASAMLRMAERAVQRTLLRLKRTDEKYSIAWEEVKSNTDVPEVRTADAALDRMDERGRQPLLSITLPSRHMRVLCVIRPVPDLSPEPRLISRNIEEIPWKIDPLDGSALALAAMLKKTSMDKVHIAALMLGSAGQEPILCTRAAFADELFRADIRNASSVLDIIRLSESNGVYDLIMLGARCLDGDAGLGAYIAGGLGRRYIELDDTSSSGNSLEETDLPAVAVTTSEQAMFEPDISAIVEAYAAPVKTLEASHGDEQPYEFERPVTETARTNTITTVTEAADYIKAFAAGESAGRAKDFTGEIKSGVLPKGDLAYAIIDPTVQKPNMAVLSACRLAGETLGIRSVAIIPAPERMWHRLIGLARSAGVEQAYCLDTKDRVLSVTGKNLLLDFIMTGGPLVFAGESWNLSMAYTAGVLCRQKKVALYSGVTEVKKDTRISFCIPAYEGRLLRYEHYKGGPAFVTIAGHADFRMAKTARDFEAWAIDIEIGPDMLAPMPPEPVPTLTQADVIIDLGYGVRDREGLALANELKKRLEEMGLSPMFGATRKVTQDLKLLPLETQIGQTGVRVNPRLIIALGISGAPQHIDYISSRAEILCFNKDPDAPLMRLNMTRPAPKVHPIPGDIFVTVRGLIDKLS